MLVLLMVMITVVTLRPGPGDGDQRDGDAPDTSAAPTAIEFGSQDVTVAKVEIPAGTTGAVLLPYDVDVAALAAASPRAAMVAFRIECHDGDGRVEMQSDGKVSTNVFLAHGGNLSGHALTAPTEEALECQLLASAPFIETTDDGLTALSANADLRAEPTDGEHLLALHRLDDATLVQSGAVENVLSLKVEDPSSLDSMSTTVRLTSCTVVGGSRDGGRGENKCLESMTGRESSTVRMRVIARWLNAQGEVTGTTNYWDETLAVDYSTHHVPWTLRQSDMAQRVSDSADAVVLVVQVQSVAGTPVVVHADGTDAVITIN